MTFRAPWWRDGADEPARAAIRSAHVQWTATELRARARRYAASMATLGGAEPLALCAEHDAPGLAVLLGALGSGRVIAPLDGSAPAAQLRETLTLLGADYLLTDNKALRRTLHRAGWPGDVVMLGRLDQPAPALEDVDLCPDRTALIVFTSGSTGRPKGIEVPLRSLAASARTYAEALSLTADDRVTWLTPLCFGASMTTALGTLTAGATLHPFDATRGLDPLAQWLRDAHITVLHAVPSLFRRLAHAIADPAALPDLRLVKLGGEAAFASDVLALRRGVSLDAVLLNGLGMSEAAGNVCFHTAEDHVAAADPAAPLPVGRSVDGVTLALVDADTGLPTPPGGVGLVAVISGHVANGYLSDAALTAERFRRLPAPHDTGPVFLSPDLGRWLPSGDLQLVGRADGVVKVRGKAVAVAAVEGALLTHPAVAEAVVLAEPRNNGEHRLNAFVVADPDERPAIRAALEAQLPAHAIPAPLVCVAELPRLAGGKIDRSALRRAGERSGRRVGPDRAGRLERQLAGIWQRALDLDDIGVDEDFVALGGSSLAAAEVFAAIDRQLAVTLPLSSLATHGTVRRQAALITEHGWDENETPAVLLQPHGAGAPVFCVPGKGVDVFALIPLARRLTAQPFYGLQQRGMRVGPLRHTRMEDLAADYIVHMRRVQPVGPYRLVGASFGGRVVFEMARQLLAAGESVALAAFLDTYGPGYPRIRRDLSPADRVRAFAFKHMPQTRFHLRGRRRYAIGARWYAQRLARRVQLSVWPPRAPPRTERYHYAGVICDRAAQRYHHDPVDVRIDLFRADTQPPTALFEADPLLGWSGRAHEIVVHAVPGKHGDYMREPIVVEAAARLQALLDSAPLAGTPSSV